MARRTDFQRARSPEARAEREAAILEAAADLFREHAYHEISDAMIASAAGFTRPNLYRYFAGRAEVFLALLQHDLERWVQAVEREPVEREPECDPARPDQGENAPDNRQPDPKHRQADQSSGGLVAATVEPDRPTEAPRASVVAFSLWWTEQYLAQPRLPHLLPLMSTSLEEHSSEERLKKFKLRLRSQIDRLGLVIRARVPWLAEERIPAFASYQLAILTGYSAMSHRGPAHEAVLADPRLQAFRIALGPAFREALETWLLAEWTRRRGV